MADTAFAHAFDRAGVDTAAHRLFTAASNALAKAGNEPGRAIGSFTNTLRADPALLTALALAYLRDRAADMRGQSLIGGGHPGVACEGHSSSAPAGQSLGDDGGQKLNASAIGALPPSSPPEAERGGHHRLALEAIRPTPPRSAPVTLADMIAELPPARQEVVQSRAQQMLAEERARRAAKPQPYVGAPRTGAAIALVQPVIRTVLDTFHVRDGRSIGDVTWGDLLMLARTNERESRVLRFIEGHVANAKPNDRVRDVVKAEVVEEAIRLAKEADNVGA